MELKCKLCPVIINIEDPPTESDWNSIAVHIQRKHAVQMFGLIQDDQIKKFLYALLWRSAPDTNVFYAAQCHEFNRVVSMELNK
jgi:hypothetical protein